MAAALPGIAAGIEAITGAAALAQGAHENAVQYQQDARTGVELHRQNNRLMAGPGAFPGYSENVQGYTSPNAPMYGSTPQFTDGAPQQGGTLPPDTQVSTMPVGNQPAILNPDGTVSYPGALESIGNAVQPQQGNDLHPMERSLMDRFQNDPDFRRQAAVQYARQVPDIAAQYGYDVGSDMGGQPVYMQPQGGYASSFIPGPYFFTDTAPTPNVVQAVAPTSRKR